MNYEHQIDDNDHWLHIIDLRVCVGMGVGVCIVLDTQGFTFVKGIQMFLKSLFSTVVQC